MHLRAIGVLSVCVNLLVVNSQADLRAQEIRAPVQVSALDGKDQQPPPCGKDGILNCGGCANDPDCPQKPPPSTTFPTAIVDPPCAGKIAVFGSDNPFAVAARAVASRYPDFKAARKASNPSFIDAHPSGMLATGHGELKGYGVTMIQGTRPDVVENASGDLADPSLLFFEKTSLSEISWDIIGMGYSYQHDRDNDSGPTLIAGVSPGSWWLHEAGYHHSPGDGGFTCATNDDLRNSAFDAGKRIDANGCKGIDREDLKTREITRSQTRALLDSARVVRTFNPPPDDRVDRSLVPTKRQCSDGPLLRLSQAGILLEAAVVELLGRFFGLG
jgi:hypothetical protein